ncbi:MAG: hypothetical protein BGO36_10780 [Burkholderiales bacterium 68-10]|jgi:hypothetical protein|nr:MAG: hypothetical protein BGO36_10780 [Burkholderiales bacterium 68-10]
MNVINLIPAGVGESASEAQSAPFTLNAGSVVTLAGAPRGAPQTYWRAQIERQMSDGAWDVMLELSWADPQVSLYGDGTYRVRRLAGGNCIIDGAFA